MGTRYYKQDLDFWKHSQFKLRIPT